MKLLCVAHPDDEVIWFNPKAFDKILIVFGKRSDKPWMEEARLKALQEHPLNENIIFLNLPESGYWKKKERFFFHQAMYQILKEKLRASQDIFKSCEAIFTHNAEGEYGHADHILVHDVIKQLFYYEQNIPIWTNGDHLSEMVSHTDIESFALIKKIYLKHNAWTWREDYLPDNQRYYRRLK